MQDHTTAIDRSTAPSTIVYAPTFNVAPSFIDRHLEEGRADKVVIRSAAGDQVTYGQLAENVNRAGNALLGVGIGRGERLLMMIKDCPEFFYTFWGAIKAGIVPVPINTLLRTKDYQFMITDSGCAGLVYCPEFAGEVEPALALADHKPAHALLTEGHILAESQGQTLQSLMAEASSALDPAPTRPEDDCFWLYSSGTTGTPKGVVHGHRDMVETSEYFAASVLGLTEDDICFSAAKMFFAYGLGNAMTFPLWVGASTILLPERPTSEITFEVIEKFKPTVYFGVPTLYAAQLKLLQEGPRDLSSLRICASAGEALPGEISHRWKAATGTVILDGIGSTEALHTFISNAPDDCNPGTSGRIVPGYEAKIIDENGGEAATGEIGRLLIRGGSLAKYYWNNPQKTAETMVDGWLDTGDTYFLDGQGYFHYCGRNDDMLKVGGIWCSPFEIESRLTEHAKVLEAAVVGRADDNGLIKPQAFVVLNDPADAGDDLADELRIYCKSGLAKYKYPRWFNFLDVLPRTATGKVQRFKLR